MNNKYLEKIANTSPNHPLLKQFSKLMGRPIGLHDSFDSMKADDLDRIEMVMAAEDYYGKELPDNLHHKLKTPHHIISYFEN